MLLQMDAFEDWKESKKNVCGWVHQFLKFEKHLFLKPHQSKNFILFSYANYIWFINSKWQFMAIVDPLNNHSLMHQTLKQLSHIFKGFTIKTINNVIYQNILQSCSSKCKEYSYKKQNIVWVCLTILWGWRLKS